MLRVIVVSMTLLVSLALAASASASFIGVDSVVSTEYSSGWVTGSGPTGATEPFGTWIVNASPPTTNNIVVNTTTVPDTWLRSSYATASATQTNTFTRPFQGGDLMSGQTFSYNFGYRWNNGDGAGTSTGSYLRLMDGANTVISIDLRDLSSPTVECGQIKVTTPGGVDMTVFTDTSLPTTIGAFKDFSISIELGSGANFGKANVSIDGWQDSTGQFTSMGTHTSSLVTFDSGWFAYTGSPDGIEIKSLMWANNLARQQYFDDFAVSGEPVPEPASIVLLALGACLLLLHRRMNKGQ